MINKKSQRRKIEGSKEESRRQTKKETDRERESRGYTKRDRGERQKVKDRESRTQEQKKTENVFIQKIDSNKGKKEENNGIDVCTIYLCWGDILKRPKLRIAKISVVLKSPIHIINLKKLYQYD